MQLKRNSYSLIFTAASFLIPFIVFIMTLAPTVTFIDAGELAVVCSKLAVAHPTGYPLFSIIGGLFSKLPIGDEVYRLNLMNAVISSITCAIFFNLLCFILYLFNKYIVVTEKRNKTQNNENVSSLAINFISFTSVLLLAFSLTFWKNSLSIEVYALHCLFIVLMIYLILKASFTFSKKSFWTSEKYWILFAFVTGLSFTNHLSTLFLGIACLFLYFSNKGFNKESLKGIGILAIPFAIGLSVYSYLFIRADNTILSWGHPNNWTNFYRHVSGKQFSVWMFSSSEIAGKQLNHFFSSYPAEFVYIPLIFALIGLFFLFSKNKKIFYFTILLFVFNVLYAINYDIYDIDSYFLLAYIVTAIWISCGLLFLIKRVKENRVQLAAATLILVFLPVSQNYSKADESKNYFVQDFTFNTFASAPEGSIIFSSQWDFWVSASMYYQYVKNIRPDLIIIDKELLRKSWYMKYLQDHYPQIYEKSKSEFDAYIPQLIKFEENTDSYTAPKTEADRLNLQLIQSSFLNLMNSIVEKNYVDRSIFVTYEIEQVQQERISPSYKRIPQGLLMKLSKDSAFDGYTMPKFNYTISTDTGYHISFIMSSYYNSFLNRANYLMNHSKYDEAEILINDSIKIYPSRQEAHMLLKKLKELKQLSNNTTGE